MKKILSVLALLLALCLLSALVACGSGDSTVQTTPKSTATGAPDPSLSTAPAGSTPAGSTPAETTGLAPEPPTTDGGDDPVTPPEDSGDDDIVRVGSAEELAEVFGRINTTELPGDTQILLTADIDMTGFDDASTYEPIYLFSGVLDGGGHTIRNLNWNFYMTNDAMTNMPTASEVYSYIFEDLSGDVRGNCYARATVALLILQLDAGCVKNLTLADSSLTIHCTYNKNYKMYVAGAVGYMIDGQLTDVTLSNVDLTVPSGVNYNHAYVGWAAPLVGCTVGNTALSGCSADAACTVDASANGKTNAAKLVGAMEDASGSLTITDCTSQAELRVHPDPTSETLMYTGGDVVWGGEAVDALVGEDFSAS